MYIFHLQDHENDDISVISTLNRIGKSLKSIFFLLKKYGKLALQSVMFYCFGLIMRYYIK